MANISFPQYENESFWIYFNRLEDFIKYYGYSLWEACEITYWGLNEHTRGVVENMFNGEFRAISSDEAWDFYMWLARDTYDFDCANSHNSSNVCMNSFDESSVLTSGPLIHDFNSPPSYAYNNDVHSNVDDIHAISQYSSNLCMDFNQVPHIPDIDSHMLDYEPLPQFDAQNAPPTIVDPLLQLEIDLKLLREKWGCNDDILKFDYVDSRDVENENQLGKSSLDLDDGFWSSDDEEYALEEKRPIIEDIVEIEDVYESIHSLFESNVSTSNELDLTLPPCALECLPSPTIPSCSSEDLGQCKSEIHSLVVGNVFEDLEDGKGACKESLVEKACDLKTCDIGEVICETLVSIPSPYIPFSRKLDLLPSFPISFPYLPKIPPLNEPPSSLHFQVPHLINFEEESEIATKKEVHNWNNIHS
ncbi:uncharacterized protein LOC130590397 [Beta vulgaris subsp. vulgaris]|uniref:uncharacterized protein LOC130590397 n=1 Tax=Beta vulgaris subsp. vulgaris TaxID=3555 RepID=UPI002547913E|nr:uncharacterized protein LOC130590397 [Beta vulgaris subsp. vulgaris]